MEYLRPQNLHKILVDRIFEFLKKEEYKKKNYGHLVNNNSRHRQKIILKTGEAIYPDMINFDRKVVYEIHVKGERRGNYFDKLPEGWRGINVFYDEEDNPETLVVKFITNEIQIIKWPERYEKYKTAIKPHVQSLKDQIKNKDEEIMMLIPDLLKTLGITGKISIYGLMYVLFFEGIVLTIERTHDTGTDHYETVFIMRERIEGDILPASLITEDGL